MATAKMKYKRLPGGRRGFFRSASLWLGDDHLLAITGWRFKEEYNRYYYRDIQAVVVARTRRWAVTLPWVGTVLVLAICWLVGTARSIARLTDVSLDLLVAVALAWLLVALKGSVKCRIQTAVSREELPSILRFWTAGRALRILSARVAQVQGALIEGWTAHVTEAPVAAPAVAASRVNGEPAQPVRGGTVRSAPAFYISLALGGILFYPPIARFWFAIIVVQMGLAILTLVRQDRAGDRGAKRLVIATMSFVGLMAASFYITAVVRLFRGMDLRHPRAVHLSGLNPVLVAIYTAGCLAFAAAGALSAARRRKG